MKYTRKRIRWMAQQFGQLTDPDSLGSLLRIQPHLLQLLAVQPHYKTFRVPKKNGTFRLIEDPEPHLKQVQKRLNTYLQAVYYLRRTLGAYGFQITVEEDNDKRNILTNAQKHLGNDWMLNADFQDFFHQINYDWVFRLFSQEVFSFEPDWPNCLRALPRTRGDWLWGRLHRPCCRIWRQFRLTRPFRHGPVEELDIHSFCRRSDILVG